MRKLLALSIFLLLSASIAEGQQWSGIIANNGRAPDWSAISPGVVGGIPSGSYTQCGSTVAAGASASTINSLLAACGANTYLLLGPGTFNLSTSINFTNISHVVLRGSGPNTTFLIFSGPGSCPVVGGSADVCISGNDLNYNLNASNIVNWTSGYSRGSTTISLGAPTYSSAVGYYHGSAVNLSGTYYQCIVADNSSSDAPGCSAGTSPPGASWQVITSPVPNLVVGNPIILDQFDDSNTPSDQANDNIFVCGNNLNVCSINGDNGEGHRVFNGPSIRAQQQDVTVTQCDSVSTVGHVCASGANITISSGLYMANWCYDGGSCATSQPQAWWATSPIFNDGIENLSMDHSAQNGSGQVGVQVFNCDGCWMSGVRSIKPYRSHYASNFSPHFQVQNSYFFKTFSQYDVSYGLEAIASSDGLWVNNLFENITADLAVNGDCSGCVSAYNFGVNAAFLNQIDNEYDQLLPGYDIHSEGDDSELAEGNIFGSYLNADITHGSHNMNSSFRNATAGFAQDNGTIPTNATWAFQNESYNRFSNIIDNVFGGPYTSCYSYCGNGTPAIQTQGGSDGNPVPADYFTISSAFWWGNWDPLAGSTGGQRFCGSPSSTNWASYCEGISGTVTSCSASATTATCNTTLNPNIINNRLLTITGNSVSAYNISVTPTASTSTTVTFTLPAASSGAATGTGGTITYGSMVPTATTFYPNSIPASTTFPASFFYASKPSWWPAGKAYPPIGGDVTGGNVSVCIGGVNEAAYVLTSGQCPGGTLNGLGGHITSIPAMDMYLTTMGGSPIGTDANALAFPGFSSTPQAGAPSCTPTSGVVPQTVTCTNPNTGTTLLCYAASPTVPATNGLGTACTTGTQYTTALTISSAETLNVIAGVASDTDSAVVSYTYSAAAVAPTVTTTTYSSVTTTTAVSGGTVTATGGASVTAEGVACGTSPNPTAGSSCSVASGGTATPFTINLSGLTAATTYYIRAYATNSAGTGYGTDLSFTTTSTCATPLSIAPFTVCQKAAASNGGSTNLVSVSLSPTPGNGILIFDSICNNDAPAYCDGAPTQTLSLGDNINAIENCSSKAAYSPHSPYLANNSTIPDIVNGWFWYCPSIPSGVTSFTATWSAAGYFPQINVWEIKAGTIAPTNFWDSVDNVAWWTTGSTGTVPSNGSTTEVNEFLIGYTQTCGGNVPQTPGAGWTAVLGNTPQPGAMNVGQAQSITGSYNLTSTWSTPGPTGCGVGGGGFTGDNDSGYGFTAQLIAASTALTPSAHNFGSITIPASSSATTFTVTNNDATTATAVTPSLTAGNTGDFAISGSTCSTLTSGGTCTFLVTFTPTVAGARSATLTVTYSGGDGVGSQQATVSGTGVSTPTAGTPSCVPSGGGYNGPVVCTVTGGAPVLCYTLTGAIPATNHTTGCTMGTLYTGAVTITGNVTLKIIAGGTGYNDGAVSTYGFTLVPVAPTLKIVVSNVQNQSVPITNSITSGKEAASIGPQSHVITINTTCTCTLTIATGVVSGCTCPQSITVVN